MLEPRAAFGVCWHLHLVYLCGGTHPSIETFNPLTLTYTAVCSLPEKPWDIAAFFYLGTLHLLSKSAIWMESAGEWRETVLTSKADLDDWWQIPYCVSVLGHNCYFLCERKCVAIDLRTLTETSYFPTQQA